MNKRIYLEVLELHNLTTDINLLKNQPDELVEAIEYNKNHIVFEAAERSCGNGQLVSIEGVIHLPTKSPKFTATGKISKVENIGNKRIKISVEIHSYDRKIWDEFHLKLNEEQESVDKLFRMMKGDE